MAKGGSKMRANLVYRLLEQILRGVEVVATVSYGLYFAVVFEYGVTRIP